MIKVVVIGAGNIGSHHIDILEKLDYYLLTYIIDVNAELRNKYGDKLLLRGEVSESNILEVYKHADLVVIATPHSTHFQLACSVIECGTNVLIEKPATLYSNECDRLLELSLKNGVKVWEVKQNRYNLPVSLLKERISNNEIGELSQFTMEVLWSRPKSYYSNSPWRGTREYERGLLYTIGSHFLDVLIYLTNEEFEPLNTISDLLYHDHELEDVGVTILKGKNCIGSFSWSTIAKESNLSGSASLIFEKSSFRIGGSSLDEASWCCQEGLSDDSSLNDYITYKGSKRNHHLVYNSLIKYFETHKEDVELCTIKDAGRTIRLIEHIYKVSYAK